LFLISTLHNTYYVTSVTIVYTNMYIYAQEYVCHQSVRWFVWWPVYVGRTWGCNP